MLQEAFLLAQELRLELLGLDHPSELPVQLVQKELLLHYLHLGP